MLSAGQKQTLSDKQSEQVELTSAKKTYTKLIFMMCFVAMLLAAYGSLVYLDYTAPLHAIISTRIGYLTKPAATLVNMEPLVVNLDIEGKDMRSLHVQIKLALADPTGVSMIEEKMPKIRGVLQFYLRELRPADLQGSIGLYRLHDELLLRINKMTYPQEVEDIIFEEVSLQ